MTTAPRSSSVAPAEPIAVIGIGCRFPGARDPEGFWRLLRDGVDAITEVPKERWDVDALFDPDLTEPWTMNTRWGGFIEGVDAFSPAFFGISQGEASSMDPQHRLLLEVSWEALENAGQSPEALAGSATGVYVGIGSDDYSRICFDDKQHMNAYCAISLAFCFAANRISKFLDLRGPSISLDTGCSSSLSAVHLACQDLRSGKTSLALAGGVSLLLSPLSMVAISHAWMMAPDGRCKSFDARANGYVRGEGCGVVVLKRLEDALRDGDCIWGVIRGSAINQDGRETGLGIPNPAAQRAVIATALDEAGVSPAQIDYVEAHGVGTKAADIAEATALGAVFGAARPELPGCLVGSVKTNIGHLESAAGVAALIKVLLSLDRAQIPRTLHFQALHPDIGASGARIEIPTEPRSWPRSPDRTRRAGINSFGLGGANAHLVIEEAPLPSAAAPERSFHLLTLSAKSEAALRELASRYAAHLSSHPREALADLCFTANMGRAHFSHRLALVSASAAAAREELVAFAAGASPKGVHVGCALPEQGPAATSLPGGQAPEGADADLRWLEQGRDEQPALERLAARYVRGATIDWAGFTRARPGRKLRLPTYPFERRRCWIDREPQPERASAPRGAGPAQLEAGPAQPEQRRPELSRRIEETPPERRLDVVMDFVEAEVARVLGLDPPQRLDRGRGFFAMGITSLMAIDLQSRLQAAVGRPPALPSTLIFEFPTVEGLSAYLLRALSGLAPAPRPVEARSAGAAPGNEPIAIIGLGCRFPGGADDPDTFFQLLLEGWDAITEVPKDRWDIDAYYSPDPDAPGKMSTRHGGFLRDIRGFDPEFFGIAPREAAGMDPQHRLLLEVSWEALERAGVPREKLAGSQTGVFVGILGSDYHLRRLQRDDPKQMDAYFGTGVLGSAAAGRVSYALGLQGPAMVVDTACSSSLVAVHLACRSLLLGECDLALAGGVNILLSPNGGVLLSRSRALAADGRCKTFDASADGYVRSEGCGVVVLKRLSAALADGDEVLAVIAGSAVNQDGASGGFTVPSGSSQQELIRRALAEAGVRPAEVGYVEAHGTGTPLGDPIEARALGAVLSEGRPQGKPFLLGSVKTNIGHLEAAAGIAGLIKVVLSLRHERIPPHLHLKQQNPRISPDEVPARIPTETWPWPAGAERRIAGVSSFGLSGTNAHVVVAEAPQQGAPARVDALPGGAHLVPLSAHSEGGLKDVARAFRSFLAEGAPGSGLPLADIAYTAGVRRTHHGHRLALVGKTHEELRERLGAFLDGEARPGLSSGAGAADGRPRRLVFVFPGQGSQWPSMARQLLREEPVFRAAIEACGRALRAHVDWSLLDVLSTDEAGARLDAIDVIQPVLFGIEVALAALWASLGVRPDAVIGHSMGEVAAAAVAGALSLEDAARVICQRSRLARRVSGRGAMAVVDLPMDQAAALLRGLEDRVSIAVSNSPRSTVLSGDTVALSGILEQLKRDNVFCRPIKVDFASHSPHVDPLRADLLAALAGLEPRPPTTRMYSTVIEGPDEVPPLDATYWMRNLREPVLFSAAVQRALADGHDLFIEMSPHPILLPAIEQILVHVGRSGLALPSLRREQDERAEVLASLGALHAAGYRVDFRRLHPAGGKLVQLPRYPWQNEPYWFDDAPSEGVERQRPSARRRRESHPVLGEHVASPSQPGLHLWEIDVDAETFPYLKDHRIHGTVVVPGMAYISLGLSAAEEVFGPGSHALIDVEFRSALFLPEGAGARTLQTTVVPDGTGGMRLHIHSRASKAGGGGDAEDPWIEHMSARIEPGGAANATATLDAQEMAAMEARCDQEITPADFYRALAEVGNQFGPRHQGVVRLRRRDGEALGHVTLPPLLAAEAGLYVAHPALLDSCFQVGLAAVPAGEDGEDVDERLGIKKAFMPVRIARFTAHGRPGASLVSHAHVASHEGSDIAEGVRLVDGEGRVVIEATGIEGQYLERSTDTALPTSLDAWLYEIAWQEKPRGGADGAGPHAPPPSSAWLLLADERGAGEALAKRLAAQGEESILVSLGDAYERMDSRRFRVRAAAAADMTRLLEEAFSASGRACRGVVHLVGLDAPTERLTHAALLEAQRRACMSVAHLLQAVAQRGWSAPPRLWLVTRGAQRLDGDAVAPAVAQAPLWGLGRVLAEEHPSLWGGLLDLSPAVAPADQIELLCEQIRLPDGEDQLAFRGGRRYVARLVRRPHGAGKTRPLRLRTDGTYLITGGLGGIGLEVARWMVGQGARRLILMGRTRLPPRAAWGSLEEGAPLAHTIAAIREMESLGASIHLAAVDVSDEAELSAYLAAFRGEGWPPIRGVIHAAAVVKDAPLLQLDQAILMANLQAKLAGGYLLHQLLADDPLDLFVLFSSGSAVLSSPFFGAYAAANAFLDALAHARSAEGRPALSINWGFWAEVGLVARAQKERGGSLAPQGMGQFTPKQAFEVMKMLLERDAVQTMVAPVNWLLWGRAHPTSARSPLLTELINERSAVRAPGSQTPQAPPLRGELLQIEPGWRRRAKLEAYIQEQVGQVLRLSPSKVGLNKPIGSLGLDSLMGLELRNRFEASMGLTLPATLVWTYPTVAALADHLAAQMNVPLAAPEEPPPPPSGANGAAPEADELSEEAAEALLMEALAMVQQRSSKS
ncbi:SDR family NAD(P)-dependent oxidoreductase [Sorangium sp. So ce1389]|uniref:SDR family NAD(P)-dependent oxidoreductase n=1 Tax=Sorangium sp. So ce1389 TaxID=3133336 RepID=UPI003F63B76B